MNESIMKNLLSALDTAVMERQGDGSFDIWGTPPDWFKMLLHPTMLDENKLIFEDGSSFLGNFVIDAADFWKTKQSGQIIWSGPWEETLEPGRNVLLEAGAACLEGKDMLIVRSLGHSGMEYRKALQSVREEIIAFEKLTMLEKDMEKYSDYLEQKVLQRTLEVRKTLSGVIEAIAVITEMRDPYTAGHQRRVADLACAIAREMELAPEKIESLHIAGALHDIGKIYVPAEILSKPGKLTELEIQMLRAHCQAGYDILKNIDFPWPIAQIVLQHHENIDGSGYPAGLSGDSILLKARILRVADVVESMLSHRPYRPALGTYKALEEIERNRGILYDSVVADTCLRLFREKGFQLEE